MTAATEVSSALVSSFLTIGTPTAFTHMQSPRDDAGTTPRGRADGWGAAVSMLAAEGGQQQQQQPPAQPQTSNAKVTIGALTAGAPPASQTMGKRSWSTLSFGDGQDTTDTSFLDTQAAGALGRFMSEDFQGFLNRESSELAAILAKSEQAHDAAGVAQPMPFGLGGIAEGSASPTNVESAAPVFRGGLQREKSSDMASLLRAQSDDFSLRLFRERSLTMLQSIGVPSDAASAASRGECEAPACPPPSAESGTGSAALPPTREEDEEDAAESSSSAESEAEEEPARRVSARNVGKPKRKLVELDDSDDDYMPPSTSKKGSKKAKKGGASRPSGYSQNNRGAHVKGRPEMQETARNGQRHWKDEVNNLRAKWQDARCFEANPAFQSQLELMARRHIKNQHECLLRALHIAAAQGMIDPAPFNTAEGRSFLGWTGFSVRPDRAAEFRSAVEEMFPQPLLENTLHNTFRRAGLVPSSWSDAWLGFAPFGYKKPVA